MAFDIQIEVSGVKEVLDFLRQLPRRWQIITHDEFVKWGRKLVKDAERLSPEDKLRGIDTRRRPTSEQFKLKWRSELEFVGRGVELNIGNIDPKAHLILFPTSGGRTFTSSGPWPLRYYLPSGQMMKSWEVTRGDTPGQPVHEWVLKQFDSKGNVSRLADALVRRV